MVRVLQPWHADIRKRQVKSPKVYFRDTGILHALLSLPDVAGLQGHPKIGASWEGFAMEQVIQLRRADAAECYFWATHGEAELDLLIDQGGVKAAYEFKYTSSPRVTHSLNSALHDLGLDSIHLVTPGEGTYPLTPQVWVTNLAQLAQEAELI